MAHHTTNRRVRNTSFFTAVCLVIIHKNEDIYKILMVLVVCKLFNTFKWNYLMRFHNFHKTQHNTVVFREQTQTWKTIKFWKFFFILLTSYIVHVMGRPSIFIRHPAHVEIESQATTEPICQVQTRRRQVQDQAVFIVGLVLMYSSPTCPGPRPTATVTTSPA